jgi:glyoxylase-like metal-dependent hydrolase (beta-lactamase superfamily II)
VAAPRIHHLNCGTMCPFGGTLVNGEGGLLSRGRIVCHVLLIELDEGLALVDTGFGMEDVRNPKQIPLPFTLPVQPRLLEEETAIEQIKRLGFDPTDVRHVIVTHLDIDHAGGLPDFPHADVHVFARELEVAMKPPIRELPRYSMGAVHWKHGPRWATHKVDGDPWYGFESVRVLPGSGADVLMVPLAGHTLGHTGIAIRRDRSWLLHCGDAYFYRGEIRTPPDRLRALEAFQTLIQADGGLRRRNQERLRELANRHSGEVELICSHDPVTFDEAHRAASAD